LHLDAHLMKKLLIAAVLLSSTHAQAASFWRNWFGPKAPVPLSEEAQAIANRIQALTDDRELAIALAKLDGSTRVRVLLSVDASKTDLNDFKNDMSKFGISFRKPEIEFLVVTTWHEFLTEVTTAEQRETLTEFVQNRQPYLHWRLAPRYY
jgi:hypothetical protein